MDNLHKPLTEIFKAAPLDAIPNKFKSNGKPTKSYTFLSLMVEEQSKFGYLSLTKIFEVFRNDGRSPRQNLENDRFKHWLIDRVRDPDTKIIIGYKLNERHLLDDPEKDKEARQTRRKELAEESLALATNGRKREPKALKEVVLANKAYRQSLGDAANDSNIDG
ncbi:MAG: hypothetical protein ACTJH9_07520 [Pseudoalteromonas sp.]|uniref:hypothetical protein n=1 Tax=Pseudoalteromonas sp. TaxID=53249 RepID=UPI003F9CBB2E